MISYKTLLNNRRSIRDFKPDKVSPALLEEILNETCMAPSASNSQPWRFIIIQDRALIERLSAESKKNLLETIKKDQNSSFKRYERILSSPNTNVFYNAPCLVLFCGKNDYSFFASDFALAVAYFMFAATSRGLGTCWVGLGDKIKDPKLKNEIGLPENYEIAATVILGSPAKIPDVVPRKSPVILKTIA